METRIVPSEVLRELLVRETTHILGRNASFLFGKIVIRKRLPEDGRNWDASIGIAELHVHQAFERAVDQLARTHNIE